MRTTYSILAVALSAACGGSESIPDHPTGRDQLADQRTPPAADDPSKDGASASTETTAAPKLDPSPSSVPACDRDALNEELSHLMRNEALAQHRHFRCLCDDKGFPLVGNVATKLTTASSFCEAVRDEGLL